MACRSRDSDRQSRRETGSGRDPARGTGPCSTAKTSAPGSKPSTARTAALTLQWIEGRYDRIEHHYLPRAIAPSLEATSDAEGRFRLTGIGRNRLVRAQLRRTNRRHRAPPHILSRPGEPISIPVPCKSGRRPSPRIMGPASGTWPRPTRPITGVVRDKATKKPLLAGSTIRSHSFEARPNEFEMI